MKQWSLPICAACALILTLSFGLWPFHGHEVRSLLPVQVILAERTPDGLTVTTDNGLSGTGENWRAALEALEAAAPGEVFYGTTGAAFLPDAAIVAEVLQDGRLRPAIRLYRGAPPVELSEAMGWSERQQQAATLGAIRAGRRVAIPEAGV